ncbi:Alpha/Beta hydrolase protein [Infundibulicybe gibba]|nr:Alpha/Beta hydrolase protein [Infundibulicybe gibba]
MQDTEDCNTNPSINGTGLDPATNHYTGSKLLTSADGTRIYAEAVGLAPGPGVPTIVFTHGQFLTSVVFDAIFADDVWTRNAYLVRYDGRGQGRSGQTPGRGEADWEPKRFAEDFEAVVNAFELDRPFVAGCITDVLSFHPPEYLSGIIYIAAIPYTGPAAYKIGSPASVDCITRLFKPTSVPDFQSAAQMFMSICAGTGHTFPFPLYQICLGNAILQPAEVTWRLLNRTQDETGLLRAGREGRLPLLFLYGTKDEVTKYEPVLDAIAGWVRLDTRTMEAGHTIWLDKPTEFREAILQWTRSVCQEAPK